MTSDGRANDIAVEGSAIAEDDYRARDEAIRRARTRARRQRTFRVVEHHELFLPQGDPG